MVREQLFTCQTGNVPERRMSLFRGRIGSSLPRIYRDERNLNFSSKLQPSRSSSLQIHVVFHIIIKPRVGISELKKKKRTRTCARTPTLHITSFYFTRPLFPAAVDPREVISRRPRMLFSHRSAISRRIERCARPATSAPYTRA